MMNEALTSAEHLAIASANCLIGLVLLGISTNLHFLSAFLGSYNEIIFAGPLLVITGSSDSIRASARNEWLGEVELHHTCHVHLR